MSDTDAPETLLDRLRDEPGLSADARDGLLNRLVARFLPDRLLAAAKARLGRIEGGDGGAILRLVEAFGDLSDFGDLAEAMLSQADLPAERAFEALGLLDAAGILDGYPPLREWWDDLNETIDGTSLDDLVAQLDGEPDGVWVALQGLGAIEPEVRAEIIAGLADAEGGAGLVEFLRLLAFAHDPATRWAALDALDERSTHDPGVALAWRSIAASHPDPGIAARATARLDREDDPPATRDDPRLVRSLVTGVDGEGRATILLATRDEAGWSGAAFLCHVVRGVVDVIGRDGVGETGLDEALATLHEASGVAAIEDVPELARRLLAGSLSLCGPMTTPALRYWVEKTAGPAFRSDDRFDLLDDWDPSTVAFDEMPARARAVLAACPGWADASDLSLDLAREVALRAPGEPPDPRRDAGAYRYFFEHRLAPRVELYQRMLLWMATFWRAAGDRELSHSAVALAWQLADPQHDVPSHPFFVELTTRSFLAKPPRG